MPAISKNSETKSRILMGSAWVLTAVVSFAVGQFASEAPVPTVAAPSTGSASGTSSSPAASEDSRAGGVFAADAAGNPATAATVGEITGGQPLEEWLKRVMEQEDELFRMQNFMKLLGALNTPADVEAALKVIMAGGGRGRGPGGMGRFTEMSMLMSKFVQLDPKAAMAFSTKLEGGEKFMATSSALRTWTRLSPDAALAWAQTEGKDISMDFGRGGGPGGPGGPGGGGGEEGAPKDNFALLSVVSQLAKTDLDKALTTATSMEIGRFGDRMVDTLANEMITQRGAEKAKSYLESLPAGQFRDQYLQQVANELSKKDPSGTTQWIGSKAESGDAKRRALGESVGNWVKSDFAAASAYVNSQPVGPDMDSARPAVLRVLASTDPQKAWSGITTISDPERQARAAFQVGSEMVKTNKDTATQIIQNTPIPSVKPETVTAILNGQGEGGGRGFGGNIQGGGGGRPRGR
jgi:hypothetical protein